MVSESLRQPRRGGEEIQLINHGRVTVEWRSPLRKGHSLGSGQLRKQGNAAASPDLKNVQKLCPKRRTSLRCSEREARFLAAEARGSAEAESLSPRSSVS